MRSERVCSLARYVMSLVSNTANTHAVQWSVSTTTIAMPPTC